MGTFLNWRLGSIHQIITEFYRVSQARSFVPRAAAAVWSRFSSPSSMVNWWTRTRVFHCWRRVGRFFLLIVFFSFLKVNWSSLGSGRDPLTFVDVFIDDRLGGFRFFFFVSTKSAQRMYVRLNVYWLLSPLNGDEKILWIRTRMTGFLARIVARCVVVFFLNGFFCFPFQPTVRCVSPVHGNDVN